VIEDSDLTDAGSPSGELQTVAEPAQKKRLSKTRRLMGMASLALLLIVAVVLLTPSLRKDFLPRLAKARSARAASSPADPEPLLAVPVLWEKLDLDAMPDSVAQDLRQGKYYYDKRLPGNFGMAIDYWKQALALPGGAGRDEVKRLVASAEEELARQFSSDSGDAMVLLKQGKRGEAVSLLGKMRADYLDIAAPQYVWTSKTLSRYRR
jgi:hypothetical protein